MYIISNKINEKLCNNENYNCKRSLSLKYVQSPNSTTFGPFSFRFLFPFKLDSPILWPKGNSRRSVAVTRTTIANQRNPGSMMTLEVDWERQAPRVGARGKVSARHWDAKGLSKSEYWIFYILTLYMKRLTMNLYGVLERSANAEPWW
jgi:hypothetical protein